MQSIGQSEKTRLACQHWKDLKSTHSIGGDTVFFHFERNTIAFQYPDTLGKSPGRKFTTNYGRW
jgi:hypothetical protein